MYYIIGVAYKYCMHVLIETSYLHRFFITFSENGLAGYRTGHTEFAPKIIASISLALVPLTIEILMVYIYDILIIMI